MRDRVVHRTHRERFPEGDEPPQLEVLGTQLRHVGRREDYGEPSPLTESRLAAVLVVDSESAIARLGGNREFYQTIVSMFLHDGAAQYDQLVQRVVQADYPTALRNAHTLKGLAATIGATHLAIAASHVEILLKRRVGVDTAVDLDGLALLNDSLAQLEAQLSLVMHSLTKNVPPI